MVALLVAPLIGSALYCSILMVSNLVANFGEASPSGPGNPVETVLMGIAFVFFAGALGSMLTYAGILLFGIPTWVAGRYFRIESSTYYLSAGALGGFLFPEHKPEWVGEFGEPFFVHKMLAGALTLWTFWMIARVHDYQPSSEQSAPDT